MEFTLMPNGPSVFARDFVRATQEMLRAGVLIAVPGVRPAPPLRLMIRPQPAFFSCGADAGGAVSQDMNPAQGVSRVPDESSDRFRVKRVHDEWNDIASGLPGD